MRSLKQALLDEYGSFADRRIKRLETGHLFIVDDRTPGDIAADGDLLSYFCLVFADVVSENELKVSLRRNVPISRGVKQWIARNDVKYVAARDVSLEFTIRPGQQELLAELAHAIRSITAPGSPRYAVPSYKYVCPRTAKSLERLKAVLDRTWSEI